MTRNPRTALAAGLAGVLAGAALAVPAAAAPPGAGTAAAPYLYLGWDSPPDPVAVMRATGITRYTMAFVLAQNGCNPAWDGQRPLAGGADARAIAAIRAAGGDVIPSFGGWSGSKLGTNCRTPEALAAAYQKVIDEYRLTAIDLDIENDDELNHLPNQDRIIAAVGIVKQKNPGIRVVVTLPTFRSGLSAPGKHLVENAKATGVDIDVYTIMPFNFGCTGGLDMYDCTVESTEALRATLRGVFGWTDQQAYARMGISGMNGASDNKEVTTPAQWTRIRDWARGKGLARFTYWAINRDRSGSSGTPQADWEFARITAGF
ncbi:hypothetical protein GCM10010123_36710 [Pilimelia anulata]|uniref:Chitinase n=1 Tax=Pilimelia anulata TaxID=53371 RepID=A0A8J3FBW6_9ACTN|nr:chitinase [Pilimelia anulata]GGK03424.1 hypothetical protein GCM10010123_36710 [Pilimelia anulata]